MPYFTHDGLRLHYRASGSGPLAVLLPGNTASSAHYVNELTRLQGRCHAVSLDLRGTGQSDRLDAFGADWQTLSAGDTAALVDHLGAEQAVLIGTSGGAMIALLCAAHYPDRVSAVIADSFVPRWPPELLNARADERRAVDEGAAGFWIYGHGEDWRQVVDADTRWMEQQAAAGGLDLTAVLEQVRCPVLLTGSLTDSLLPDGAAQLLAAVQTLPHGELYLCGQGDHPLIWTAPDYFWPVSEAFLARVWA